MRPQEAAKGTTKRISLGGIQGVSATPIDVDIPAGVDSGQTIQVPAPAPNAPGGRLRVLLRVEVEPHPLFRVSAARALSTPVAGGGAG